MPSNIESRACALAGVFGLLAAVTAAHAADLPSAKEPASAPVVDSFQPFFVKVGFTYALNTSSSRLWGQSPAALALGDPTVFPAGVGATLTDVATLGFEVGVFLTRNISVDVSGGIPFYVKDKTKGYNPANPGLFSGTTLSQIMPAIIPITVLYHFDNFGSLRPYIGGGVAVGWSFDNRNAFLSDVQVGGSVGPVVQGGFDYMINRDWGVSLDVKKAFNYVEAHSNGLNIPGIPAPVPAETIQHTHFEPWLFSISLLYRFGGGEPLLARY